MSFEYRYFNAVVPDFVRLTDDLDVELYRKQGESQKAYQGFNKLDGIHDVVLAFENGNAVGCASFKDRGGGAAEVKRVFVRPEVRGRGVSKALMAELEKQAAAQDYRTLLVETSRNFAEAVGLYTSLGYAVIPNYPPYEGMADSLCFRKELPAVVGLDHVQVAIPQGAEDRGRAFYCGVLGLAEIEKPENLKKKGGFWVQCGRHQLHLGVIDPFVPATKAHPAFEVRGLAALRTAWVARGAFVLEDDPLPGAERFYLADPFGNRLEFLEWNNGGRP